MINIKDIETKSREMAGKVYEMLILIEKGFMDNKTDRLLAAMKEENLINETEKALTARILELSKSAMSTKEKEELVLLEQVVETLERMGDEAAGLIERIEMKIAEHLLFSDLGVQQFNETFNAMKKSVEMMREFLKRASPELKDKIIDNGFHVKGLVERYRKEHFERLVQGVCTPMAANMYFDMLDFTGNLARHSSNIVKLF